MGDQEALTKLSPDEATRRQALINAALNDPQATWTIQDIMLVTRRTENTVLVWRGRGLGMPKPLAPGANRLRPGRAQHQYNAAQMLQWLVDTERLLAGSWTPHVPRTGSLTADRATGNRAAAYGKGRAQELPGGLSRALKQVLGLRKGATHDFIVRRDTGPDGELVYSLLVNDAETARRILDARDRVAEVAAREGHPLAIASGDQAAQEQPRTAAHAWGAPQVREGSGVTQRTCGCGVTVTFMSPGGHGRKVFTDPDDEVLADTRNGDGTPPCTRPAAAGRPVQLLVTPLREGAALAGAAT